LTEPPTYPGDLYARANLRNPYPAYRTIRDLGPAVWMPRRNLWAIGRFDDVRAALRAGDVLISGKGVAANDQVNARPAPITLTSDGAVHDRRRGVLMAPVMPAPVKALRPRLETEAQSLVARLATGETFDAMATLAAHLPVTVIAELVGLDERGRAGMLQWAAATFNALGVMNRRGRSAFPELIGLTRYAQALDRASVTPGGWADQLFDARDRGELSPAEAQSMIMDYVAPALDTTILATGYMLRVLSKSPGAWARIRADPALIPGVVNEVVRLASPIRGFTRFAAEDYAAGDVRITKGDRVLILFAGANYDERHYSAPETFEVTRNPRDHLAWGHGPHTCVGMHLARLEMEIILTSLAAVVDRIETRAPRWAYNNVLQGFASLPTRLHAGRG
jgi:cytochrome P450